MYKDKPFIILKVVQITLLLYIYICNIIID